MILDDIVAAKRKDLAAVQQHTPLPKMQRLAKMQPPPLDFAASLRGSDIRLIAEIKQSSPSAGIIRPDFDPVETALIYADNGAAAISVLTESRYFKGSLDYLKDIKEKLAGRRVPLLRKDFIIAPYQVYESRAYGADAILLIAAILTPDRLKKFITLSRDLGMEPLVEIHDEAEAAIALHSGSLIIGINNRDLNTFNTDVTTTKQLRPLIPEDRIVVSESGIKTRDDIAALREWRVDAVLIGEALMASSNIALKIKGLFAKDKGRL